MKKVNSAQDLPLVSVIVPTYNSAQKITTCIRSILNQTYPVIEVIVVDNFSTDQTVKLAKKLVKSVFQAGKERSSQRNFGAKKAAGQYLFFVDSDMKLRADVVKKCIDQILSNKLVVGVIVPEESTGTGFWAKCKNLERSFYIGVAFMEAARFFEKKTFLRIGGYNEQLISGEDWDLSQRIEQVGQVVNADTIIYHDEGFMSLGRTVAKKFYYAKHFTPYMFNKQNKYLKYQTSLLYRYAIFFSRPQVIAKRPIVWLGMLVMKTAEFGAGGLGFLLAKLNGQAAK